MCPLSHPKYMKTPRLAEVIRCAENFSTAYQLKTTLTPSTISIMSSDNKCFVCWQTHHFGCHCPDTQCYGCDEFGHFVQDCPHKNPPSGTQCHHGKSHSRHWYTHNWRDRSHSCYSPRHRRHYSRSQSNPCSHCDKSSSFRRHTSCSSSSHCSSTHCPSADGCFHHTSYHDNNRHSYNQSCTCHFSHRCHSHHSMNQNHSCSSTSCHAAQDS